MTGPVWSSLPDGWRTGQVKNVASVTLGKMLQGKDSGNDVLAPYVRAANVQPDGVLALRDVKEMWFSNSELSALDLRRGDVVVVEGGQGGFGRAAFVDEDLAGWAFQNSINRLRPATGCDGRYLAYFLIALRASGFIHASCNIVSMPHFTAEKLARTPMPLPPRAEQRAIADFLDRETARIDTLIGKQTQLITTLEERRKALIMRAVTKGINPEAPTVESGVRWLGLVPKHWRVVALRRIGRSESGSGFPPRFQGRQGLEYPFFKVKDLGRTSDSGTMLHADDTVDARIAASLRATVFPKGTLVYAKVGAALMLGRVRRLGVAGCIDNNLAGFIPGTGTDSRFLQHAMTTVKFDYLVNPGAVPSISDKNIMAFKLALPPLREQATIVSHIEKQASKLDELIAKTERFIQLSKERRSALITAAVTGQLDVRDEVA